MIQKGGMRGSTRTRQRLWKMLNLECHIPLQIEVEVPSTTKLKRKAKHLQRRRVSDGRMDKEKSRKTNIYLGEAEAE